jgi:hypothetical protein
MSKARRGSVLRRGSMVNVAVPKLARRMELQKCFDDLVEEDTGSVERRTLATIIQSSMDLCSYFNKDQYDILTFGGNSTHITWIEFLMFIQQCEKGTGDKGFQIKSGASGAGGNNSVEEGEDDEEQELDDNVDLPELVPRQSRGLEVELVGDRIVVGNLDSQDIRVLMGGSNKIVVKSDDDPADLVAAYAQKERIPEHTVGVLFDNIERAIIRSCCDELTLLNECSSDCVEQLDSMAQLILGSEDKMLDATEDFKRFKFQQKHISNGADRRASIQKEIEGAAGKLSSDSMATPAELARKLLEVQKKLELKTKEHEKLQIRLKKRRGSGAEQEDAKTKSKAERDEWRRSMDTQLAILKLTNEERSVMIRENSVLRTTLNCTGKEGKLHEVREKIVAERKRRLGYISELQMEMIQLEAELRISHEEFDAESLLNSTSS